MATINRQDGVEFVVQPYRELLAIKNLNILKREVRNLGNTNGSFVRLLKQPNGYYEAIFSHDPGFLLGESIWNYFGRPQNFIYVEELNKHEVICVVVRNYAVFLDGRFAKEQLKDELQILNNSEQKFSINVYGDVPLAKTEEPSKFNLNPNLVKNFIQLDESVFADLKVSARLQLLNLEQALQEYSVNKPIILTMVLIVLIAVVASLITVKTQQHKLKQSVQEIDPYLPFKEALATPAPSVELQALAKDIAVSYSMPGWLVQQVTYKDGTAKFTIHSMGGNFAGLYKWAQNYHAEINLDSKGASIALTNGFVNRSLPLTITNAQEITARIIDNMLHILPGKSVSVGEITDSGVFKTMGLEIQVQGLSPDYLPVIGEIIRNLPVKFVAANFTVDAGLLTGTIQLTVLGN